MTYLKADIN